MKKLVIIIFYCIFSINSNLYAGTLNDYNPYNVNIPDNGLHVSSDLSLSGAPNEAAITKVKIYYKIRHTNPGDLDVWLTAYYDGSWHDYYLYHYGDLGSSDDIIEIRDNLHHWDGASPNQTWYLVVQDRVSGNVGYIDFFELWVDYSYNQVANTPSNPNPTNGATNISKTTNLDWIGSDPDGDTLYYTVYFKKNDSTPYIIIKNDSTGSYADPGTLDYNSHYYWQVKADDHKGGATWGPVWNFYTQSDPVIETHYSVTIWSNPTGADVHLGTVEAPPTYTTSCTLTGLEGNQIVWLTKDGYEDLEFILTPNDDGTTKNFPLTAAIILNFTAPFSGASADHIEYEGPHFGIRVLGTAPSDTDSESGDIHHASTLNLYAVGASTWQVDDTVKWDFSVPRSGRYKISINGHILGNIAAAGIGVVYDCKHLLVVGASIVDEGSVYSRLHDTLGDDVTSGIWEISTFGAVLAYNVLFPEGGGWVSYVIAAYEVYKIVTKMLEILIPVKSFNYNPILGNDWYFYADLEENKDYQFEFFVRSATVGGVSLAVMYSFTDVIVSFTDVTFEQISGSVTEPIIEVIPVGILEMETTYVGQSTQNSSAFTVKNVGNQLLTGSATIETGPFEIISGANYSLNPGEQFDISIRFLSDEAGIYTRKITFSGGGGAECYVRCEAREADPVLEVYPNYIVDFGEVAWGTSMDMNAFVVANTGGGTLTGNVTVNPPFSIISGQSYSLTEGQTDNVMIRFVPPFEGIFNGNVVFTGGGGATRQVTGEGIDIAVVPLIDSILNDSIMEGSEYFGPIPVLIQGTQPITWSLVTETVGMIINVETGFVKWPNPTVGGSPHTITIRATNTAGYDDETWLLIVRDINRPPILDPIGSKTVNERVLLEFTITANDPDGDALTYSVSNLPTGASFDVGTQTFSWTPGSWDSGDYEVLFTVTDNGIPPMSDSETVTITVGDINRPPVLDPIGSKTVNEGLLLEFTITANDPDGDALTYSVSNLPTGASFDVEKQTFSWTPGSWDIGNYEVMFTVTDNGIPPMSDSETVTITVGDINRPPVLDPIGNKTVNERVLLEFTITANDPDGDALTYSVSNLPTGASFDVEKQTFSWIPGSWDTGDYEVMFTVTDNGIPPMSDSEVILITVETSGVSRSSDGCFIATVAYDSLLHPYVRTLRDFRDTYLMPSRVGRKLVDLYHKYSPFVADLIVKHKQLKVVAQIILLPMIAFSYSILHFGPVIIAVILIFLFTFPIFLILFFQRKMRQVETKKPKPWLPEIERDS